MIYNEDKLLEDAINIAIKAGEYLKIKFNSDFVVNYKNKTDLVTEVDYGSEKIILDEINLLYPEANILSEEAGEIIKDSKYKWVIDPLDGTINFSNGIPIFGVIISILKDDETIIGINYLPMINEMYTAVKGKGSYLNGKKIFVSNKTILSDFIIGLGDFNIGDNEVMKDRDNYIINIITSHISNITMRTKIFGAACYDLSCIASGKTDALFYAFSNPWDVLAGKLLIEEAGGKISYIDELTIFSSGQCLNEIQKLIIQKL